MTVQYILRIPFLLLSKRAWAYFGGESHCRFIRGKYIFAVCALPSRSFKAKLFPTLRWAFFVGDYGSVVSWYGIRRKDTWCNIFRLGYIVKSLDKSRTLH